MDCLLKYSNNFAISSSKIEKFGEIFKYREFSKIFKREEKNIILIYFTNNIINCLKVFKKSIEIINEVYILII